MTVYSRTPAPPPRRTPTPLGRPSYVRQHNVRPDFRVPLNYSGNTFRSRPPDEEGESLPTPVRQDRPDVPIDELLPPSPTREAEFHETHADQPLPVAILPARGMDLSHFPFGHGLGGEELLLLGLIFFLLKEGEGQGDRGDLDLTVILLAALLFCG